MGFLSGISRRVIACGSMSGRWIGFGYSFVDALVREKSRTKIPNRYRPAHKIQMLMYQAHSPTAPWNAPQQQCASCTTFTCTHLYVYIYTHVCYRSVCICVHVYMYMDMRICTYMYIFTHTCLCRCVSAYANIQYIFMCSGCPGLCSQRARTWRASSSDPLSMRCRSSRTYSRTRSTHWPGNRMSPTL